MKALALLLAASLASAGLFGPYLDPLAKPAELFEAGKHEEVIAALSPDVLLKLRRRKLARAYYYLGASLERTGRTAQALSVYQLGAKLFPRDVTLLSRLGLLLHHLDLEEQAEPMFRRVLQLDGGNDEANLGLAEIDRSLGFFAQAAVHYEEALDTNYKDRPDLWRDYAEVLLAHRDAKTAEQAARKALDLRPEPETRFVLARALRAQGLIAEALAQLDAALAAAPEPRELLLARALWSLEAGRHDAALRDAESALRAEPADPLALWVRARIHLKADRFNAAARDLELAAAGSRQAPFVAQAAAELLSLLKSGSGSGR